MKKLMSIVASALCAAAIVQAGDFFPGSVTVEAGSITGITDIPLTKLASGCATLDRFTAAITEGSGTGTVYLVSVDHGIETAIANSAVLTSTALYDVSPKRSYTVSANVGYAAVTGDVVVTGSTMTTSTNKEPYMLRNVRVRVIQPATAADDTVYNFGIFAK